MATKKTKFASPPLDEIFQWTCHLQDRRVANYDECFLKLGGACACELRLPINPEPWGHILDRMARQEATSATLESNPHFFFQRGASKEGKREVLLELCKRVARVPHVYSRS